MEALNARHSRAYVGVPLIGERLEFLLPGDAL